MTCRHRELKWCKQLGIRFFSWHLLSFWFVKIRLPNNTRLSVPRKTKVMVNDKKMRYLPTMPICGFRSRSNKRMEIRGKCSWHFKTTGLIILEIRMKDHLAYEGKHQKHNSKIDFVLLVDNTDERIISRTIKRRICPKCGKVYHLEYKPPKNGLCECGTKVIQRSDDTEEKIRSRLNEFQKKALPALNILKEQGIPIITVLGHLENFTSESVRKSVIDEIKKVFSWIYKPPFTLIVSPVI